AERRPVFEIGVQRDLPRESTTRTFVLRKTPHHLAITRACLLAITRALVGHREIVENGGVVRRRRIPGEQRLERVDGFPPFLCKKRAFTALAKLLRRPFDARTENLIRRFDVLRRSRPGRRRRTSTTRQERDDDRGESVGTASHDREK